jgi:hypothetical protein
MPKEWIKEEINFWKELFSFFSKVLILIASAIVIDIKTNQKISNLDYFGILSATLILIASLIALLRWKKYIKNLREVENGNAH